MTYSENCSMVIFLLRFIDTSLMLYNIDISSIIPILLKSLVTAMNVRDNIFFIDL